MNDLKSSFKSNDTPQFVDDRGNMNVYHKGLNMPKQIKDGDNKKQSNNNETEIKSNQIKQNVEEETKAKICKNCGLNGFKCNCKSSSTNVNPNTKKTKMRKTL